MTKNLVVKSNLRNQQRVDVATEARIEKPDGSSLVCSVSNISRTGLMISCGQEQVRELIPGQQTPAPGTWIDVKATFPVPVVAGQPVSVVANGHIVYMRRISRNEFQIGVQFAEFDGNGFEYVDNYVSKLLAASAL
ncbi:PilZ domain-containing protein [Marinobacter confluentis]|uniref:PilZ domain-containing protein n=1 Tax=Marinobacter confluentis TaxID=1697557 RepID=A0A4Z1BQW1_9GAMM|nr:PilZ domain-containing protein [Marinobacter confluentis]TGN40025.1 PilZ domain-containing protein [Marinobacter confluentis]